MQSQMLITTRRPARLRARQMHALSATGQDCFASHQKPKRFAVRGRALPECFARHRLPPTAKKKRSRCKSEEPRNDGKAKYALPIGEPTILCPRIRRAEFAQSPHAGRDVAGSVHAEHVLKTFRVFAASSNYSRWVRDLARSAFMSRAGRRNVPEKAAICPTNVRYAFYRLQTGCRVRAFVFGKTGSRPIPISLFLDAGPNDARMFRRALVKSSRVGCLIRLRFASRVVFRASSAWRPNLSSLVLLTGVAGQVSGLMSSRAGRAHRDCLPLITTPSNRFFRFELSRRSPAHGAPFVLRLPRQKCISSPTKRLPPFSQMLNHPKPKPD